MITARYAYQGKEHSVVLNSKDDIWTEGTDLCFVKPDGEICRLTNAHPKKILFGGIETVPSNLEVRRRDRST